MHQTANCIFIALSYITIKFETKKEVLKVYMVLFPMTVTSEINLDIAS